MLKVDQIECIRKSVLVEGMSIRQVAKDTGFSRNTIRKYLRQSEAKPEPRVVKSRRRRAQDRIRPRVEAVVDEAKGRTTAKQRLTSQSIWRRLQKEDPRVSLTSVQRVYRALKRKELEVYVPLPHFPGDEALVDFFEVQVDIGSERHKAWLFLMRLAYSGRDFVRLYERCDQVALLDAHVRAFRYFGGVPKRIVYDNLAPAVKKVLKERELTVRFKALTSHYLFESCFARPGEGHDKGGVESRGKHLRLQYMSPIPKGRSLDAISESLLADIEARAPYHCNAQGQSVAERAAFERPLLRALPEIDFQAPATRLVTISSKATFQLDKVTYSVPSRWARLKATVYLGPTEMTVACHGESVVRARKQRGESGIEYLDYLPELRRKPQAVRQVAPLLIGELGEPFDRLWKLLEQTHGGRNAGRCFAAILGAVEDHGLAPVRDALVAALAANRTDLIALARNLSTLPPDVQVPHQIAHFTVECARATDFDRLLEGVEDVA